MNTEVSPYMLVNTGVNAYITRIFARFPQLDGITAPPAGNESSSVIQEAPPEGMESFSSEFSSPVEEANDDTELESDSPGVVEDEGQKQLESHLDDLFADDAEDSEPALEKSISDTKEDDSDLTDDKIISAEDSSDKGGYSEISEKIVVSPGEEESDDAELESDSPDLVEDEDQTQLDSQLADLLEEDAADDSETTLERSISDTQNDDSDFTDDSTVSAEDTSEADDEGESSKEIYEENIDVELFAVFLELLKNNLSEVQTLAKQLPDSAHQADLLNSVTEKITRLRAATNYMGYEQLTALYDQWLVTLEKSQDELSHNDDIDSSQLVDTCIDTYITRVLDHFPQIDEIRPESVIETDAPKEENQNLADQLPQTFDKVPRSDMSDGADTAPKDRTAELFSSDDQSAEEEEYAPETDLMMVVDEPEKQEDKALEDRLARALDLSLSTDSDNGSSAAPKDPIGDLFPKSTIQIPAQDEIKSRPVAKSSTSDTTRDVEQRKVERHLTDRRAQSTAPKVIRQSLRVDANKIDELMNQAGELVFNRAWFSQLFNEMKNMEAYLTDTPGLDKQDIKQVKGLTFKFNEAIVALGRVASELQEGVMKVRMLPISQLYNRYPRLVRDLVHGTDKDVELETLGVDTELDKMIIEEISDPLIHIIRNAVDHGIETVSTRKSLGKPDKGLLRLNAYHEGSFVIVEVFDDGRGIDPETIKAAAMKKGLVPRDELFLMSPKELTELILRPGFSTTEQITRTSGRGVGMDVVKKNLENLNGTIEINSKPGRGTSIRIKIPLTLAVIKALLVRVRDSLFTIPLFTVDETLQIQNDDINSIKGNEVIYLRNSTIPLIRLSKLFRYPTAAPQSDGKIFVVIVSADNRRVGLMVDELRGQEEVVIKPLPDYLQENNGFSGATVLGDGRISLILDVNDLVKLTIGRQAKIRDEATRLIHEGA